MAGVGGNASRVGQTFLTASDGDAEHSVIEARVRELKDRKMKDVMEKVTRMNLSVDGLGENIKKLLRKQEKDFLAAYRAHMYKVQKELQELKDKNEEAELELKKNNKIQQLEKERDWFRREALRLDTFATTMQKDLKYMKEKLEATEDDRHWLEGQLKASKKQNKLLCAELDIRLAGPESDPSQGHLTGDSRSGNESIRALSTRTTLSRNSHSRRSHRRAHSAKGERGQVGSRAKGLSTSFSESKLGRNCRADKRGPRDLQLDKKDKRSIQEVTALRRELRNVRIELARLRAKDVERQSSQAEMEELFLQCIEEVKRDVARRKRRGAKQASLSSPGVEQARRSRREKRDRRTKGSDSTNDIISVTTDDFTATDKIQLVNKLMSNDDVLSFVYEGMFPAKAPAGLGSTDTLPSMSGNGSHRNLGERSYPEGPVSSELESVHAHRGEQLWRRQSPALHIGRSVLESNIGGFRSGASEGAQEHAEHAGLRIGERKRIVLDPEVENFISPHPTTVT